MSGMAEVLAAHHVSHADWDESEVAVICHCGVEIVGQDNGEEAYVQEEELYALHLEAELTAAGFGPVKDEKRLMQLAALMAYDAVEENVKREAAAVALEEAAKAIDMIGDGELDEGLTTKWLRARAAAVRGEA